MTIIIDNKNVDKASRVYRIGQTFIEKHDKELYILSQVGFNQVSLISIQEGKSNRWREPIKVADSLNITVEEFNKIKGCGNFVEVDITVTIKDKS